MEIRFCQEKVLIAPGDFHMEIYRSGGYYYVKLLQEPPLHGVRPAADYLINSLAHYAGTNAIGIVLTGMEKDGTQGLVEMKIAGSFNFAQDEESSVVFGMPKVAIEKTMPLDNIASEILRQINSKA